jgi:hypothetical protein
MDFINDVVNEIIRQQKEYTEKTLAEIITKYDFIVGSMECRHKLMEILPDEAKIIVCSQFITDPTTIYAVKKFDIKDLLSEPQPKIGHWVYNKNLSTGYGDVYTCSECDCRYKESCYDHINKLPDFCPNCHTKMEVE